MSTEKSKFISALFIPFILLLLMWVERMVEFVFGIRLIYLGIHPLYINGLPGIILSPFIHGGFKHLAANSVPFLILGTTLFYFYRDISIKVLISIWILTGIWVWFGGREAYHIGASGIIYGLASFLFISGIIRKDTRLAALTLVIAFLYGGLIWGAIPNFLPNKHISWESHLGGLVSGTIMAFYYKKSGPQRKKYSWELEEEAEEAEDENDYWNKPTSTWQFCIYRGAIALFNCYLTKSKLKNL